MSSLDEHLSATLAQRVVDLMSRRGPGHCLLVPHLPEGLADGACRLVQKSLKPPDAAFVVVADPRRGWQARPAKVVELRNNAEHTGGRLGVFAPAGQHLAAEDSFGRSTFEVLDVGDLHRTVGEQLRRQLQTLAPDLVERADDVIAVVSREERFAVDDRAVAAYLAATLDRPSEEGLADALAELGLLPDAAISTTGNGDVATRLARNLQQMETLTDLAPPIDRVHRMSLPTDEAAAERLTRSLVEALADGTTDRQELGHRLARSSAASDFSDLISAAGERPDLDELTVLALSGDFASGSDPPTLTRKTSRVKLKYRCRPAAGSIVGLKELRLELLNVTEQGQETSATGVEAVKRGKSLPKGTDGTWGLRLDLDEIDAGLYELRIRAFDEDNLLLAESSSERFRVREEIEPEEDEPHAVPSIAAARVAARVDNPDLVPAGLPLLGAPEGPGGQAQAQPLRLVMKFDGIPGRTQVEVSRALALVERYTLEDPRSLARYRLDLDAIEIDHVMVPDESSELPEAFLDGRAALFEEIVRTQLPVEGAVVGPLVALCDLGNLAGLVRSYMDQWRTALSRAEKKATLEALLCLDQITFSEGQLASGVLIGPTHPLRLAWLLRYDEMLTGWALGDRPSREEADEVRKLLGALAPAHLPHVVASGEHAELRYVEPVDLHWGIWAPPNAPDIGALAATIRTKLGLPAATVGSIGVGEVVQRIRRYLSSHPYVDLLQLNFVQAGPAEVVLRALTTLQSDPATSELRYVVRLFATELSRSELGRSLDEFMADSESAKGVHRDAADAFLSSTEDPLTPKLTYSKHQSSELLRHPERFPAHMTFFLDWFELDAVPVPPVPDRRSFFVNGLIADPVVVYRPGQDELNPQWDEHVAASNLADGDWFIAGFVQCAEATARFLEEGADGTVPAVRLELDRVRRSILDAVHRTSDWVVVIDPVFSDEYLDAPAPPGEGPRYLIDSRDPGALETTRRIMVSTRSRTELVNLLRPISGRYDLEIPDERIGTLLDALHALSPGLALSLLNNRTQALEAMSLALASIYLNAAGVLRRALVIPLDLHLDLFAESSTPTSGMPDLRRTDLAVVQFEPDRRRLAVNLIEVKARGQLAEAIPPELLEQVRAQLDNSKAVLRRRLFSADLRGNAGSLAASLMVRRLTRLLSRYLERAARYRFVSPATAVPARQFVSTLDRHYSLVFTEHAIFFDLEGPSRPPVLDNGLTVHRVGRDEILDLLARTQTPVGTQLPEGDTEHLHTVLGAPDESEVEDIATLVGKADPIEGGEEDGETGSVETTGRAPVASPPSAAEGPAPEDVLVLGITPESQQFGIVGRVAGSGKDVAFDVDGTNVVSVFGVQGSGKSYSVGDLVEAAMIEEPGLNRLPHPLAGVIFHYSTDQTYLSEFGSMATANDTPELVSALGSEYGVAPKGIDEIVVLVPEDLVAERASDFPGLEVQPLVLAPDELDLNDWRLLMGVEGGDQLYVKAMSNVFRQLRGNLTLASLRQAVAKSRLTPAQKDLAATRIEFVESFVSDSGGVARHVRPGRLLLVDVRDPWIEEENALALFMVTLRLCAQATGSAGEYFNKIIVFDEAHKYMSNPRLTKGIVETVREMRHKGTTVVLASQNPPSVPREVIELSSVIIAHRFTSPQWLEHIRKVNAAFGKDLTPARLATLQPGEAFVWSSGGAEEFRRPQRVTMRPRLSRHGGATRRAAGE